MTGAHHQLVNILAIMVTNETELHTSKYSK
jgi:hypothetical protein